MATTITMATAAKNIVLNALVDQLDVGSADSTGDIVIKTSGGTTLATLTFSNPAFAAASGGSVVANAITGANAVANGTADNFEARSRDNTIIFTGSVGLTGCTLNLDDITLEIGDPVSVTSFTVS